LIFAARPKGTGNFYSTLPWENKIGRANPLGGSNVKKQNRTGTYLKSLMEKLESEDGATRQEARASLVALGKPAVSSLTYALQNSKLGHVRWEAVKSLATIGDARAIPSLVGALEDSDPDVAWMSGEALREFKKTAWPPLLRSLIKHGADSFSLCQGAHHVLQSQKEIGFDDMLTTLTNALASRMPPESTTVAAYELLKRLKTKQ
jgi:hypothetical protein